MLNEFPSFYRKEVIDDCLEKFNQNRPVLLLGVTGIGNTEVLDVLEQRLSKNIQYFELDMSLVHEVTFNSFRTYLETELQTENLLEYAKNLDSKKLIIFKNAEKLISLADEDVLSMIKTLYYDSNKNFLFVLQTTTFMELERNLDDIDALYGTISPYSVYLIPLNLEEFTYLAKTRLSAINVIATREQIKTLHELTGGSHRLFNTLFTLIEDHKIEKTINMVTEKDYFSPSLDFQCKRLYRCLRHFESTLEAVTLGWDMSKTNVRDLKYLRNLGIIDEKNRIFSRIFEMYLNNMYGERKILSLNEGLGQIYLRGVRIDGSLSGQEYKFLEYMLKNSGRVVNREEIVDYVWGVSINEGVSDEAIDQLVKRIRTKIEEDYKDPQILITIRGRGFQLVL